MEGKLKRLENWPILLSKFLEERADAPFEWGKNDCIMFCADAVEVMTGVDLAKGKRRYKTEQGALKTIAKYGSIENVLISVLGDPGIISYARRGDVVTYEDRGRVCAGIVDDSGKRAAFVNVGGLVRVPLFHCLDCWSI